MKRIVVVGLLAAVFGSGLLCAALFLASHSPARAEKKSAPEEAAKPTPPPAPAKESAAAEKAPLPTLDEQLNARAGEILKKLSEEKTLPAVPRVGVLKFLVRQGKGPLHTNVGALNQHMEDRLGVALVLALKPDKESVLLLESASKTLVEAKNGRANLLDEKGRRACFDTRFEPVWGDETRLAADAFLTGVVTLEEGYERAEAEIQVFTKKDPKTLKPVCRFAFRPTPDDLMETGANFTVSRGIKPGEEKHCRPMPDAQLKKVLEDLPVEFEIRYSGKLIEPKVVGGELHLEEPPPGTKVSIGVKHRNKSEQQYGVLLKINGKNSIFPEERAVGLEGRKWIVRPRSRFEVEGFQKKGNKADRFEVREFQAGSGFFDPHIGTFSVAIFRGRTKDDRPEVAPKVDREVLLVSKGSVSGWPEKPASLQDLRDKLLAGDMSPAGGGKGLIMSGKEIDAPVKEVEFETYPDAQVLTLRYCKRR